MQVSDQIIEVLDYICKKLGLTIDWTSENVLPYVQTLCDKYISWEIATSVIWLIVGIILFGLANMSFKAGNLYYKKYNLYQEDRNEFSKYYNYDIYGIIFYVIFGFLLFICIIIVLQQIFDIIKCICFPELQVFEYVQTLLLNMSN